MATSTLTVTLNNSQWVKLQISIYSIDPTRWAIGDPVVLNANTNAVLLAADGTGINLLSATDAQISALVSNGKIASDTQIKAFTAAFWNERENTAKTSRNNYIRDHQVDLFTDPMT